MGITVKIGEQIRPGLKGEAGLILNSIISAADQQGLMSSFSFMVKDFIEEYKLNPAKANNSFLKVLYPKMKELITHINNPENDEAVYHAEELFKKDLLIEQGLNYKDLSHDFIVLTQLTEKVNSAEIEKPALLAEFKLQAAAYFKILNENNLRDWLINPKNKNKITYPSLILRILFLILLSPIYLTALIGNYLPYKLTDMLARKIVKNKEFYSSFAIAFVPYKAKVQLYFPRPSFSCLQSEYFLYAFERLIIF
jgi:hypothetical protein